MNAANNKTSIIVGIFALLVIGSGIIFAQRNADDASPVPMESSAQDTATQDVVASDTEVRIIEVEAGSFYFRPNEVRVKQGERVRIVMKSVSMMHDFVIDELNVRVPVTSSGDTATVEFVADKVGTYEYYCSVGQHRQQGQVGTLIVE